MLSSGSLCCHLFLSVSLCFLLFLAVSRCLSLFLSVCLFLSVSVSVCVSFLFFLREMLSKFLVGDDGWTAYERAKGEALRQACCGNLESWCTTCLAGESRNKTSCIPSGVRVYSWVCVGELESSSPRLLVGIVKCGSVRRGGARLSLGWRSCSGNSCLALEVESRGYDDRVRVLNAEELGLPSAAH